MEDILATTSPPPLLTKSAIVCISLVAYLFALAVLLIIKEILVSRGKCTQNLCPCCVCCSGDQKQTGCLDAFCLQLAECCNCCGPPDVATAQWWDQCCARRKGGIDCYDLILCQCCNDCNVCSELCCDPKTPFCDCQGCDCEGVKCQCQTPECQKIDCCCCEIQLKGGQAPTGGYPPPGGYGHSHGGYPPPGGYGYGGYPGQGYEGDSFGNRSYARGYGSGGYRGDFGDHGRWQGGALDSRGAPPSVSPPQAGNPFLASSQGGRGEWSGGSSSRIEDTRF